MAIKGHVYLISDTTTFFAPILFGQGPPATGYVPCSYALNVIMNVTYSFAGLPFVFPLIGVVNTKDGSFELPDAPLLNPETASIHLDYMGYPYYRSENFAFSKTKEDLKIWLYEPSLPVSDGITAGQVSTALSGHGLPGNTNLTVNGNGLNVAGSESQVSLQFGIQIAPDTTPNLSLYFDLALNGWNIHVGWPESWCESADDVLNSIRSGLTSADSSANGVVASQILSILQKAPLNLTQGEATTLLQKISLQFVYVSYPNNHTWALSNKTDKTVVIFPQPTIGYPRTF
jgi:hypothetical protein